MSQLLHHKFFGARFQGFVLLPEFVFFNEFLDLFFEGINLLAGCFLESFLGYNIMTDYF